MKNKKGFSLIELIAVITILAVLVLITIPVVKKIVYENHFLSTRSDFL